MNIAKRECKHLNTTEGQHYGFVRSVAVYPYTEEDPVAHGGITFTEQCNDCGAARSVNENAGQQEVSPWVPT